MSDSDIKEKIIQVVPLENAVINAFSQAINRFRPQPVDGQQQLIRMLKKVIGRIGFVRVEIRKNPGDVHQRPAGGCVRVVQPNERDADFLIKGGGID